MARSLLLRNSHIQAFDKLFDDARSHDFRNSFAAMDFVLEYISKPIPPEASMRFTVYKMVPVEYEVTEDKDGSIHYNMVKPGKLESDETAA